MKTRKSGKRYPLLIYRQAMDRLWIATLMLGGIVGAMWFWEETNHIPVFQEDAGDWLLIAAVYSLVFTVFAFFSRFFAYVQPKQDHLLVSVPFLRLKISYRRFRSIRSANFHQLMSSYKLGWAQRQFLESFFGDTAVVVDLNGYPLPRFLLRMFLPIPMFPYKSEGLIFVVPDWMALSNELDSMRDTWRQSYRRKPVPGALAR